jgi:general secretion pathway protein D
LLSLSLALVCAPTSAVVLNLQNTDIEAAAQAMRGITGKSFVVDPRVKGQVTLVSDGDISRERAMAQFAAALRAQGFAMVEAEGLIKIVPESDAKLQGGSIAVQAPASGQQIVTQVFRLNFENANNLVPILRPLIAPNNTINANPGNNSLIVTDYAENLRRIAQLIAALDVPSSGDVEVIAVRHAVASDLVTTLNRLLDVPVTAGAGVAADPGRPTLLADPRNNSILVRATNPARVQYVRQLIAKLDTPSASTNNIHVVYLRNAEATKLAQVLRGVLAGQPVDVAAGSGRSSLASPAAQTLPAPGPFGTVSAQPAAQVQAAAAGAGASSTTGGSAGGANIQADAASNALIITAPEPLYRQIRSVIDQLDARRAQVYIETMIVEVSNDRLEEFGVQWQNLFGREGDKYGLGIGTNFGTGGNNIVNLSIGGASGQVLPGTGLNLGLLRNINGVYTLGMIARALESKGGVNVLSTPNLLVLDNEEAKFVVGQNVPFITGQYTNTGSSSTSVNPFQTIERRDVGLSLRVRPQVSEGGSIKLQIYQEVSSVVDRSRPEGIITNKRSLETMAVADDGHTIVLGGLMEDTLTDNQEKVPLLGDAPVVGSLFRNEKRQRVKTNLMIFLRPTVLRDVAAGNVLVGDRYEAIRQLQIDGQAAERWWSRSGGGPQLPPRRGDDPAPDKSPAKP